MATVLTGVILLVHGISAFSGHDIRPKQTSTAEDGIDLLGWTPAPTQLPEFRDSRELFKRDAAPSGTCGYVEGDPSMSVTLLR